MIGIAILVVFDCGFAVGIVAGARQRVAPTPARRHELGGLADRLLPPSVAPVHRDLSACVCGHDYPNHRTHSDERDLRCWFGGCSCRRFAARGVYRPRPIPTSIPGPGRPRS